MENDLPKQFVIFDLFGTLIQFGVQHRPYRQLLKWARDKGRNPKAEDARTIMTLHENIDLINQTMGINAPEDFIHILKRQIDEELAGLKLFEDVIPTLDSLLEKNIQLGICSNLALPYGQVIDDLLSGYEFKRFLSYQLGCIKPDPKIYQNIFQEFNCSAQSCLFVGDTYDADYLGPKTAGMTALHLRRNLEEEGDQISSLTGVLKLVH